jgi:uncharacterized membrane protein YebE (DUF533 family)
MAKYLKIIAIAAGILALGAVMYIVFSTKQQERARMEADQTIIMKMLEERKQKE